MGIITVSNCSDSWIDDLPLISPVIITQPVKYDSDDPAIWINPLDASQSIIFGTDKQSDGALYAFDLNGQIIESKVVRNLNKPNNVDVEYGIILNGSPVDIAVLTERNTHQIRIYSLPDMTAVDNGGIIVFAGDTKNEPMGIALYKRPSDNSIFAIISRKSGPKDGSYLWQYLLEDDGTGIIRAVKVREFGYFSGLKEIESIAVDDELGYIYYSDERYGIRKYYANPDAPNANNQLALFGTAFIGDQEGISIYNTDSENGYIIVSDQGGSIFRIFRREGEENNPHNHRQIKVVKLAANRSDGSDCTSISLNQIFNSGLFVAMSNDRTFHYYSWLDIMED